MQPLCICVEIITATEDDGIVWFRIEDLTFDFPLLQAVLTLSFLYQALELQTE